MSLVNGGHGLIGQAPAGTASSISKAPTATPWATWQVSGQIARDIGAGTFMGHVVWRQGFRVELE
eukprot:2450190-Pyramimonas_sp.AAC.1